MGRFFSDEVELALKYIYYDLRANKGSEGFKLLEEAAKNHDADATYFFARCFAGHQYTWWYHAFPADDQQVIKFTRQSVELGSAVGVLGAMRTGNFTKLMAQTMPFSSLQEAFDIVLEKAVAGEPFCQYMIGNFYFWEDFLVLDNITGNSFASQEEYEVYLKENMYKCISWYEKAFEGGVFFAGHNLRDLYLNGKSLSDSEPFIAPQPEKLEALYKKGASLGYPTCQSWYAGYLSEKGNAKDAFKWYQRAAEGGQAEFWHEVGQAYLKGEVVPKDELLALESFEKGIAKGVDLLDGTGCFNAAGQLYYLGSKNIPQNYERAVELFEAARKLGNTWANDMLADCYIHGYGCKKDHTYAKMLLIEVDWSTPLSDYCTGILYLEGIAVPKNFIEGISYLRKAKELPQAKVALFRAIKKLFGLK